MESSTVREGILVHEQTLGPLVNDADVVAEADIEAQADVEAAEDVEEDQKVTELYCQHI